MAIDTQPRCLKQLPRKREVELIFHLEPLLLILGEHRVGELQRVLGIEDHIDARVRDVAVDAELGAFAGGDVKVGRVLLDHLLEQRAEVDRHGGGSGRTGGGSRGRSTGWVCHEEPR
jgi:hypothetical protein